MVVVPVRRQNMVVKYKVFDTCQQIDMVLMKDKKSYSPDKPSSPDHPKST